MHSSHCVNVIIIIMKKHLISLLAALILHHAAAGAYDFTHITTKNSALSYDGITTIMQDSRGFIWIGTYKGLNRYDGHSMKPYFKEDIGLNSDFIHVITEDADGNLWIGTDNGVTIYNYSLDRFVPFTMLSDEGSTIRNKVTFIMMDDNCAIWMLVNNQGCFSYYPESGKLKNTSYEEVGMSGFRKMVRCPDGNFYISRYHADLYHTDSLMTEVIPVRLNTPPRNLFTNDEIEGIFRREDGQLYIASTKNGISIIDPATKTAESVFSLPKGALLHNAFLQNGKVFWLSTTKGVWRFDIETRESVSIRHEPKNEFSISNDYTNCTFVDRNGGLWIGTKDGGVNYCGAYQSNFEKQYLADDESLHNTMISGFAEDDDGMIWVATEEKGFLKYNPETHVTTRCRIDGIPSRICSLCYDEGKLWFGTRNGLYRLNTRTGALKRYGVLKRDKGVNDPNVYMIHKDPEGKIMVGTTLGIFSYDRKADRFIELEQFDGIFTTSVANDANDSTILWLSTFADGVLRWDMNSTSRPVAFSSSRSNGIINDKIVSMFVDSRADVWAIGFSNGLARYDASDNSFEKVEIEGLGSEVFFKALEDDKGKLWLASDNGLVEFDPLTHEVYVHTEKDGLLDSKFTNSALRSRNGDMYFGSDNGFIRFNPGILSIEDKSTRVVISSMRIGDEEAYFDMNTDLLKDIVLEQEQNSFGFTFSILGQAMPYSTRIQCRLNGLDDEWRDILGNKSVFWYNVPSGQYTLEIRESSKDGIWEEGHAPLKVTVTPAFWASPTGILLIVIISGAVILLMISGVQRRTLRKKEEEAEEYRKAKEEETFREKMNFFSHVIHEIKTPLTLIKTPLNNIISKDIADKEMLHDLEVMNNSAGYLTKLVNELLDYIRIEKMGFALKCEDIDLVEKLRSTLFNFSDTIRNNNIKLDFSTTLENAIVSADIAALDKILNNLILNAVKYAETRISILVEREGEDNICIKFENDGAEIPPEYREAIFKPFVQYNEDAKVQKSGVGIGLPLARNLARMHQGNLELTDSASTCFILSFPLKSTEAGKSGNEADNPDISASDKEYVLIADDNREFREYLASKLCGTYNTICVSDGKAAWKVMQEENIDLLISDISMPDMTGLELCQSIRKDIELSHIPIIIISARVSIESKIQAMEAGADIYIEKPFDLEYLRSSVKNILDKRRLMKNAFGSGLIKTDINMFGLPKKDEEFFTRFDEIIRKNLGNNDFSNEMLAEQLNMSESTMLRKIRKLLNTSPNSYIKTVRLSVAAEMLKDSHGNNITEICYTVGFSSVSYFAKCFREQYGMTPTEWCNR